MFLCNSKCKGTACVPFMDAFADAVFHQFAHDCHTVQYGTLPCRLFLMSPCWHSMTAMLDMYYRVFNSYIGAICTYDTKTLHAHVYVAYGMGLSWRRISVRLTQHVLSFQDPASTTSSGSVKSVGSRLDQLVCGYPESSPACRPRMLCNHL